MTRKLLFQPYTVKSYQLVIFALAVAMFPRVLSAVGIPAVVNFAHFAVVLSLTGFILLRAHNRVVKNFLIGLIILFAVIVLSALLNSAGTINVILDFLILAEPFLLLMVIVSSRMSRTSIERFQFWIMAFASIHVFFAYFQKFVLGWGRTTPDDIKGIFLNEGAGHKIGGGIALTSGIYFFVDSGVRSKWIRILVLCIFAYEAIICSAKQVFFCYLASLLISSAFNLKSFGKFLRYLAIAIVVFGVIILAANTILPGFNRGFNISEVISGLTIKESVFPILISHFNSMFNWLLGLGPGHTVSRLGWLIPLYKQYLEPLGITTTPIFTEVYLTQEANFLSNSGTGSSFYSLLFTWAGMFGDLGLLGLGAYLNLWFLVWRNFCIDNFSKLYVISIFIFGLIFAWMEEPAYMLFVVSIIGLRWQKYQARLAFHVKDSFKHSSKLRLAG